MRLILQLPVVRELHARGVLFPVVLLMVVAAVLTHGALEREPAARAAESSGPLPPPVALPALRPDLEKAPLTYASDYWRQVAEKVRPSVLTLQPTGAPAIVVGHGVALTTLESAGAILEARYVSELLRPAGEQQPDGGGEVDATSGADARGRPPPEGGAAAAAGQDGQDDPFTLLGVDAELGVALLSLHGQPAPALNIADSTVLAPGSQLLAISKRWTGELSITPAYLSSAHAPLDWEDPIADPALDVVVDLPEAIPLAALVDLDGSLAAVAVRRRQGEQILFAETLQDLMERIRQHIPCRAIEVEPLGEAAAELLGTAGGVAVTRVHESAFVPEPSIQPGDVLLEWNRESVAAPEQFEQLYDATEPGSLVRYVVLRGRRRVAGGTVRPGPDCRPVPEPPVVLRRAGVVFRSAENGDWVVAAVREDSPAAAAKLARGERIVAVNGQPAPDAAARRLLEDWDERPANLLLTVHSGGRTHLRVLPRPAN